MKEKILLNLLFLSGCFFANAQVIATIEVNVKNNNTLSIPVKVDLDAITILPDSVLLFSHSLQLLQSPGHLQRNIRREITG